MAKINRKNVALVIGITVLDVGIGLYDRLVNGIGVLTGLDQLLNSIPVIPAQSVDINYVSNSMSGFNFIGLMVFVLIAIVIVSILAGMMSSYGGME